MHFIKKVPTTEQERAVKEKAQTAKLRTYCLMRDRIFEKRAKGEMDDEMLELTATLLAKNPDVYTFWNIRRTTIHSLMTKRSEEENEEVITKRNSQLLSAELALTEQCLMENSKSYGAWFHRGWALALMSQRDIKRELKFTEKALQMDSRNFHCWDHRRIVAKLADLTPQQELEFSERMINANFSNYSAWHYRSTLLPRLSTGHSSIGPLFDEQTIAHELKKLANAFFTDPEDQSAWIYTEWLIAMEPHDAVGNETVKVVCMVYDDSHRTAMVAFSEAVAVEEARKLVSFPSLSQTVVSCIPISLYGIAKYGRVFTMSASVELGSAVLRSHAGLVLEEVEPEQGYVDVNTIYSAFNITRRELSSARKNAINSVIDNCSALIEEMSHEKTAQLNKWPLFTLTHCLVELDAVQHHKQIIDNFDKLATDLDVQRRGMYQDLIEKHRLNACLRSVDADGTKMVDKIIQSGQKGAQLSLKDMALRNLDHLQLLSPFVTVIDVSQNAFSDLCAFAIFPRLTHLTLNENPIQRLEELHTLIPKVEYLSVASTALCTLDDVIAVLESESLRRFVFCETPLAANEEQAQQLYHLVEQRASKIRLIRHWL